MLTESYAWIPFYIKCWLNKEDGKKEGSRQNQATKQQHHPPVQTGHCETFFVSAHIIITNRFWINLRWIKNVLGTGTRLFYNHLGSTTKTIFLSFTISLNSFNLTSNGIYFMSSKPANTICRWIYYFWWKSDRKKKCQI